MRRLIMRFTLTKRGLPRASGRSSTVSLTTVVVMIMSSSSAVGFVGISLGGDGFWLVVLK